MSRSIAVLVALALCYSWSIASAEEKKGTKAKVEKKDVKANVEAKVEKKAEAKVEAKAAVKADVKAVEPKARRLATKVTIQPCPVCPVMAPVIPVKGEAKPETKPVKSEAKPTEAKPVAKPASQPVAPATQPVVSPVDPDDIGSIIKGIFDSAKSGKWALLVGFIVMLLTWLVNKLLKQKIPSDVLPWLSIGLGAAGTTAFALATGKHWLDAVVIGVQAGLVASGSWSAVGKYLPVVGKKANAPKTEEKPVEEKPEEPKS